MTLVSLAGQLVVLLDFLVQMTGLVQFSDSVSILYDFLCIFFYVGQVMDDCEATSATVVYVLDLLVHLVVVLELEVMGGDALPMTSVSLAGQLVVLLDFLVQMTGLVQCMAISTGQSAQSAMFATRINLVTMRVVREIMLICSHRGGRGGGYKELDEEELEGTKRRRKEAEEDDGVLYDEFGILKKKFRAKTQQAEARRVLPGAGHAEWEVDEFGVADKAERGEKEGGIWTTGKAARPETVMEGTGVVVVVGRGIEIEIMSMVDI